MNEREFENLLADALGGELSATDMARFEAALAESPQRRAEYDSALRTLGALRALPAGDIEARGAPVRMQPMHARGWNRHGRWLRYAAGLLIAFGAGYGVRAAAGPDRAAEPPAITESDAPRAVQPQPKATVQAALASAYQRNPGRSDLATCMRALFGHVD